MGDFGAMSAFRTNDSARLQQAIVDYCRGANVGCEVLSADAEFDDHKDAQLAKPVNGWSVVCWPMYANLIDVLLCETLAAELAIMVSSVQIYDGDFWNHHFLNVKERVHEFCSWPAYFGEVNAQSQYCWEPSCRDAARLCALLGVPVEAISGYLVHLPLEPLPNQPAPPPRPKPVTWWQKLFGKTDAVALKAWQAEMAKIPRRKAYPDDHCDLDDYWVFTDFWRKLGIHYPDFKPEDLYCVLRIEDVEGLPG